MAVEVVWHGWAVEGWVQECLRWVLDWKPYAVMGATVRIVVAVAEKPAPVTAYLPLRP